LARTTSVRQFFRKYQIKGVDCSKLQELKTLRISHFRSTSKSQFACRVPSRTLSILVKIVYGVWRG